MRSIFIAVAMLFCLVSLSHAARLDTAFKFSTIETPHFSIHFHQGLQDVAQKAALFAESAHDRLSREYLWQPAEKTQLVLIDDSDFTNGLTVTIPYNTIYVQVVPPSLASTIGEYDDWLKEIITHEYAHVMSSDPARGFWKVTRMIFGKPLPMLGDPFTEALFIVTAPPNTFMPRWWHEGMATWSETEYTGEGRGKGSYFDMVYRTAVAENHLPRVDEINGDVPYWPNGDLPYMFGYRLQKYIADTYGKEALGQLTRAHSGRFPYFISAPPEELFGGKNYRDLYNDMLAALRAEQEQRLAVLSRAPFTPLTTISTMGENLTNPRFSPDGSRIAFNRIDPNDHTMTVITDSTGSKVLAEFRRRFSDESICWSPDGSRIYFTQAEINRGFDVYQDIYVYDVARNSEQRLTHTERLGDVDIYPDGKTLAAVATSRGSQNLVLIDLLGPKELAKPRPLTGYRLQRVSFPRWSPDGKKISYALRDNSGHSSIHSYDLSAGSDVTVLEMGNSLDYPVWSRDGSSIFYISDETGVFNVFAYDTSSRKSYQVSHLASGALQPDPAPDGRTLAVSSYTSRGFQISAISLDKTKWTEQRGPSLPLKRDLAAASKATEPGEAGVAITEMPAAARGGEEHGAVTSGSNATEPPQDYTPAAADAAAAAAAAPLVAKPYNPLKTLYPHFWLPRLSDDGSKDAVMGAFTAGADVLGYNSYSLAADYSPGRKRAYGDFIYLNDYFYPTIALLAHSEPFLYSNLEERGDYWELNQGVTLETFVPINFLETRYLFNVGYQILHQKALSEIDNGRFNGARVFQGWRDNFFAGITFDDVLRYPYSISSEEGRDISFTYRRFAREIGSDQDLSEYSAQYREYLRLPGAALKHHVMFLRLSGALADGDLQFGQQAFQMGGIPSDLNPYPLRGYPERFMTGKYVATGTLEYRAPLFYPMIGPGTRPIFLEKVHTALFVDAGEVWDDRNAFTGNKVKVGAGIEARTDITLGYWLKITPALGFAHGFNQGGENQIYLTVYMNL
jgi:Tol biopolymer transport system component